MPMDRAELLRLELTPIVACQYLIASYEDLVKQLPSLAEIEALKPASKGILGRIPLVKSYYHNVIRGKPEAVRQFSRGCIEDFARNRSAMIVGLEKKGFKAEAERIRKVLGTRFRMGTGIDASNLDQLKFVLKKLRGSAEEDAQKNIPRLQAIIKEFS